MRRLGMVLAGVAAMLLFNCAGEDQGCKPGDCEPGGACVEIGGVAECDCRDGYTPREDRLECQDARFLCGNECTSFEFCFYGTCFKELDEDLGYCVYMPCGSDAECENECTMPDRNMCCVDRGGPTICLAAAPGHDCGDQGAACGESCVGALDSACPPELTCLRMGMDDPDAICSNRCETDADCEDCGGASVCREWRSGFSYCQAEL